MTTRIGLISDPHASAPPLAEALALFRREGVTRVLCAGDMGGYGAQLDETVALLQTHNVLAVRGNHEQWALQQEQFAGSAASRAYFAALPDFLMLTIEGISLYMVHAEPPNRVTRGLRLFDRHGERLPEVVDEWHERLRGFGHEVLILGHTHQAYAEWLGATLVINPGSCCFNHSCAILTLPQKQVEWFALGGQPISRVWNWGENQL
ncbi:MAG: metallophosphatase family protein [Gammaproteobacteria bacterium]|nr:metallophosphatase family protein [Gammaproteobacteria bacterium]